MILYNYYLSLSLSLSLFFFPSNQLIFVGDSTERGMMEALLERTDGSLLKSDRLLLTLMHSLCYR